MVLFWLPLSSRNMEGQLAKPLKVDIVSVVLKDGFSNAFSGIIVTSTDTDNISVQYSSFYTASIVC